MLCFLRFCTREMSQYEYSKSYMVLVGFLVCLGCKIPPIPSNNLWPSDGERFFARYLLLFLYMSTLSFRCQILFSFSYEWFACHLRLHSGLNIRTSIVERWSKHRGMSSSNLKLNSGLSDRASRLLTSTWCKH